MKSRWIFTLFTIALAAGVSSFSGCKPNAAASSQEARTSSDVPVQVSPAARQRIETRLARTGTIQADNDVVVVSETSGRVLKVLADTGDKRAAGAVLVKIDDEMRLAAYETAEVGYEKAKRDLARYETLTAQKSATDTELEGAKLAFKAAEAQYIVARRQYQDTEIKAPIGGVVTARHVNVGATVAPGTPIVDMVDISRLKTTLAVGERDAFALKVGDPVSVTLDVYPGRSFPGTIKAIGAKADAAHNFPVEVTLANSEEAPLRAGLFARVLFSSLTGREALTIPREALIGSVRDPSVYVIDGATARLRRLTLGEEAGDLLEVREGLREGERVVVSGQNNLRDGAAVVVK
ncbi:MAG: efflux RND transporter periplasmic adaptor subunit [Acidobacteriota bacterium]